MVAFLQAMNWHDFVVQVTASLLGAGLGGLVAYAIARSSIRADRQVREAEATERRAERLASEVGRVRGLRARAINKVLSQMTDGLELRATFMPDRRLDIALGGLLVDGSDEAYDVYSWVRWMCRPATGDAASNPNELVQRYDVVRAMLLGWNSAEDNAGAITHMRRQLSEARAQ